MGEVQHPGTQTTATPGLLLLLSPVLILSCVSVTKQIILNRILVDNSGLLIIVVSCIFQVLQHVRLPLLSPKFLVGTVGSDPLIKSDEECRCVSVCENSDNPQIWHGPSESGHYSDRKAGGSVPAPPAFMSVSLSVI